MTLSVDLGRTFKRYGITVVVILLSAYVLSSLANPGEMAATFRRADAFPYLVAMGFFYVTFPIRAVRWRILLDGVNVEADARSATVIILINWFFNTLLPAKAGDLHRGYLAKENYGTRTATALGTIAAERVIDLAVLAVGLLVGMALVIPRFSSLELRVIVLAFVLLFVLVVGILTIRLLTPSFLPDRALAIIDNFQSGLTAIKSTRELTSVLALTVVMWGLNVVRMSFVAKSVGFEIAIPLLVVVALLVAFLSGLPYTPAGVGVVEVVTTSVIVAGTGVNETTGLTFVLFDRFITVGSLVVVGALVYSYLKLTSDLRGLAGVPDDEEGEVAVEAEVDG